MASRGFADHDHWLAGLGADGPVRLALHTGPHPDDAGLAGLASPRTPPWWQPGMPQGLVDLLAEFRYKPRWRFELHAGFGGAWVLVISTWVQDIRSPETWAAGIFTIPVPYAGADAGMPDGFWQHWLRDMIMAGPERHEIDEWFTVGGQRPYDPHAR